MHEKLTNLRRKMNRTVLKKGELSGTDKERIYHAVIHSKKPKRKIRRFLPAFSLVGCLILVMILSSPYYSNFYNLSHEEKQKPMGNMTETNRLDQVMSDDRSESNDNMADDEGERSSTDIIIPPEEEFMNDIYGMTNQKVFIERDPEFGVYGETIEVTDKRINDMLAILESAKEKDQYENYEFYHNTLVEWEKGNFKNAVYVHNQIRQFIGGINDRATRLLTEEEEQKYVEKYFD